MDEVVRIELGASIIQARLILAEAREAGFTVELLANEDPEMGGLMAVSSCAILAKASEVPELRTLLAYHNY